LSENNKFIIVENKELQLMITVAEINTYCCVVDEKQGNTSDDKSIVDNSDKHHSSKP